MAVADIFKLQQLYNTNGTFNDQADWQDAFKIADSFNTSASLGAKAQDDWRKFYKNLATTESEIQSTNNKNWYEGFKSSVDLAKAKGADDLEKVKALYGYDPTGKVRNEEEQFNLAFQNGALSNPYAKVAAMQGLQKYFSDMAHTLSPYNPELASSYGYQSGLPYMLDQDKRMYIADTGQMIANEPLSLEQIKQLYQPQVSQKVAEAQAIAAARQPYILENIKARQQGAEAKQENWKEYQNTVNLQKDLTKLMNLNGMMTPDLNGNMVINQQFFNQQIATLANVHKDNPEAIQMIRNYANDVARQNGW